MPMRLKRLLNFAGDRIHTLPLMVLYLTDGCNSRCVTCDIWRNPRRNMKLELAEAIARDLRPLAVRQVVLSGGEAMQHPQWHTIAQRLRAEGVRVSLLTNGLLLRKQIDAADLAATMSSVKSAAGSLSGIRSDLRSELPQLRATLLAVERLAALLERDPEALLRGRGPLQRPLEGSK